MTCESNPVQSNTNPAGTPQELVGFWVRLSMGRAKGTRRAAFYRWDRGPPHFQVGEGPRDVSRWATPDVLAAF